MPPIDLTNISFHVYESRTDRLTVIKAIGVGEPVATITELDRKGNNCYKTLTSTGVIVIRDCHNMIITLYLARIGQAIKIYKSNFNTARLPDDVYYNIRTNETTYPALYL